MNGRSAQRMGTFPNETRAFPTDLLSCRMLVIRVNFLGGVLAENTNRSVSGRIGLQSAAFSATSARQSLTNSPPAGTTLSKVFSILVLSNLTSSAASQASALLSPL